MMLFPTPVFGVPNGTTSASGTQGVSTGLQSASALHSDASPVSAVSSITQQNCQNWWENKPVFDKTRPLTVLPIMSRQPKEDWCPYCGQDVEEWEPRRKRKARRRHHNPGITIGSDVKRWFLCPHCKEKHPWYQYEWMQAVFLAIGVGATGAVNGFAREKLVYIGIIGVAVAMVLTIIFRFSYTRLMFRNRPARNNSSDIAD